MLRTDPSRVTSRETQKDQAQNRVVCRPHAAGHVLGRTPAVPLALLLALLSYFRGRCRWRHGLRDVEAKRVRAAGA